MRITDLTKQIKEERLSYATLELLDTCAAHNGETIRAIMKALKKERCCVYKHLQKLKQLGYVRTERSDRLEDAREAVVAVTAHGYLALDRVVKTMKMQLGGI